MTQKEFIKSPAPKRQYVDNQALFEDIRDNYYPLVKEWKKAGKKGNPPPVTDYMGKAIYDIAQNFCLHRKYYRLKYIHEDMALYACLTVIKYIHNFNPDKYNKPFAYITMIVNNSFLQYLKRESKNNKAKTSAAQKLVFDQMMASEDPESTYLDLLTHKIENDKMEEEKFDRENEAFKKRNQS